jgi:hypothetical protein
MSILRIVEFVCGIITALLTVTSFFLLMSAPAGLPNARDIFGWFLFYGLPGLLLASGASSHSIWHKSWGLKVTWVIAGLSAILISIAVLGGTIGYLGIWTTLYWLAPTITSLLTGIVAFFVVASERVR